MLAGLCGFGHVGPCTKSLTVKGLVMLAWVYLLGAICLEVVGTVSLKFSNGFTDWRFAVLSLSLYGVSFWVLSLTLRTIPVSTAYAVWSGLGTAAVAVIGANLGTTSTAAFATLRRVAPSVFTLARSLRRVTLTCFPKYLQIIAKEEAPQSVSSYCLIQGYLSFFTARRTRLRRPRL